MIDNVDWFVTPVKRRQKECSVLFFPYAGGSTSAFRAWSKLIPENMELSIGQLPGRDRRFGEPFLESMGEIVDAFYAYTVDHFGGKPIFLVGHSLGGLIAYELCLKLQMCDGIDISGLVISGKAAPHIAMDRPWMHNLDERSFLDRLRRYDGTPKEIFEHPELIDVVGPRLRADFKVAELYRLPESGRVNDIECPVLVLGGMDDCHATQNDILAWRNYCTSTFSSTFVKGDHFFIIKNEETFISNLNAFLTSKLSSNFSVT